MKSKIINSSKSMPTLLRKSFTIAAIAFFAICAIGYISATSIDASGALKKSLDSSGRFNFAMYRSLGGTSSSLKNLATISMSAFGLIMISSVLNIIWMFRVTRASRTFIYIVYGSYILAQGLGFGILFLTWKATTLIAIFGIAGSIFAIMAIIGYFAKDLMPLGKMLFIGSFAALAIGSVFFISWIFGAYNDTIAMIFWVLTGMLTIGWIAFDIWWIKRSNVFAEMLETTDPDMYFRLVAFASFKLLSDLIALIWVLVRFYIRSR